MLLTPTVTMYFYQAVRNTVCADICKYSIRMTRAIVHIRIRRRVVAVPITRPVIRTIVPIAADTRRALAHRTPI